MTMTIVIIIIMIVNIILKLSLSSLAQESYSQLEVISKELGGKPVCWHLEQDDDHDDHEDHEDYDDDDDDDDEDDDDLCQWLAGVGQQGGLSAVG